VKAIDAVEPTFKLMEEMGIPLMVHGETHGFVMDREKEFLESYDYLATKFPKLKITMEHITTADAVALLDKHENLRARPEDRDALLNAALSAHPKLMFGSDSAPHPLDKKECCGCAAGVFTAPISVVRLTQLFDEHGKLDQLQKFLSGNAQKLYNVKPREKKITLSRGVFEVPKQYERFDQVVVPMHAGEKLGWRVEKIEI